MAKASLLRGQAQMFRMKKALSPPKRGVPLFRRSAPYFAFLETFLQGAISLSGGVHEPSSPNKTARREDRRQHASSVTCPLESKERSRSFFIAASSHIERLTCLHLRTSAFAPLVLRLASRFLLLAYAKQGLQLSSSQHFPTLLSLLRPERKLPAIQAPSGSG